MYRNLLKTLFVGLFLFTAVTVSADVEVNAENFPDYNFRKYLLMNYSKDGSLVIDEGTIKELRLGSSGISSLKGIEYFTALEVLRCEGNQLTALDVSKNTSLISLDCSRNYELTTLYVSGCLALIKLSCSDCQLTELDVSGCTALTSLECTNNQLASLDVSRCTTLTELWCSDNQLVSLEVSQNTALKDLVCNNNQLTSLDVSECTALSWLSCSDNQLTTLNVLGCTALTSLECTNNQLASLDVSGCTALTELWCSDNQLTTLDVSNNKKLTAIICFSNKIKGANMDAFISTLPMTFGNVCIFNPHRYDGNVCYKSQVEAIKEKYWKPCRVYITSGLIYRISYLEAEYEGEDDPDGGVEINEENFPDENFRYFLENTMEGRDNIYTDKEIESIQDLDISGSQISALKGIEYLTALTKLYCYDNQISEAAMDELITLLPDLTQTSSGTIVLYHSTSLTESNVCTKAQVAALRAKNWIAYSTTGYHYNFGVTWLDMDIYYGCDAITTDIAIDEENFPDENFRSYLMGQSYGKGGILTSEEIVKITEINVSGKNISSLEGIGYFTELETLICYNNQLTSLDVSGCMSLKGLYCLNNQLTSLDVSGCTALTSLACMDNQLTSLDVSKNRALEWLYCENNQLTSLDVSQNTALKDLGCNDNQLTSLDVSTNMALTSLECYNNQIRGTEMDKLISSLPDCTEDSAGTIFIYDPTPKTDGNICTKAQVEAIKGKNWIPYYGNPWEGWKAYEGMDDDEADAVDNVQADNDSNVPVYNLSGQRIDRLTGKKGIYIVNGKKIVVK